MARPWQYLLGKAGGIDSDWWQVYWGRYIRVLEEVEAEVWAEDETDD